VSRRAVTMRRGLAAITAAVVVAAVVVAAVAASRPPAAQAAPAAPAAGPLPPITVPRLIGDDGLLPPVTVPPLLPTVEELLGGLTDTAGGLVEGVGGATEGLVGGLPVPDAAPEAAPPVAAPAPEPAPAPGQAPAPTPEPAPASVPEGVEEDDPPRAGTGAATRPPPSTAVEGESSDDSSLAERLTAAAGNRTNLMLLALGFAAALLGASPRVHTYRRDRREVLSRLGAAYDQQRQAAEELAEADRLKSEFLGIVSHELRTPLTAVKGFVDTVLLHWDRFSEDRRRELLERASGNADDLSRLVDQLVDFARIDANQVDVDPQPLAVAAAIDDVVRDLAPVLEEHPVEIDAPAELAMLADTDAFGHVLVNLLTNAAKFSSPGRPIAVRAHPARGHVVVAVTDQGIGITPEDQERIFERFYQSRANGSRTGTGIGLAIASRFTEVQGGRISVESEPGRGSTFSFTVPLASRAARRELATTAPARAS
jgi:signal transduction histidine kinase